MLSNDPIKKSNKKNKNSFWKIKKIQVNALSNIDMKLIKVRITRKHGTHGTCCILYFP